MSKQHCISRHIDNSRPCNGWWGSMLRRIRNCRFIIIIIIISIGLSISISISGYIHVWMATSLGYAADTICTCCVCIQWLYINSQQRHVAWKYGYAFWQNYMLSVLVTSLFFQSFWLLIWLPVSFWAHIILLNADNELIYSLVALADNRRHMTFMAHNSKMFRSSDHSSCCSAKLGLKCCEWPKVLSTERTFDGRSTCRPQLMFRPDLHAL